MDVQLQRLSVPFEYPLVFTRDVFSTENEALIWAMRRRGRDPRAVFVADAGVTAERPDLFERIERYAARHRITLGGPSIAIPGGEAAKNDPKLIDRLIEVYLAAHLDRHAFVVAIGGGAVLDAVGYSAAITHRGVGLIRVPSTVLAQNDAGVGVKNGVNAFGLKNFLGTFAPPEAVLIDPDLLSTLPDRDRIAGIAEAVKVATIKDADFFGWLEAHADGLRTGDPTASEEMIRRTALLHATHIREGGDPFERGSARPLDFGHWAAHKLESMTAHRLRHGEAVAIGIGIDTRYAVSSGVLSEANGARVQDVLSRIGLPATDSAVRELDRGRPKILAGLDEFREHLGGALTLTLPVEIGKKIEVSTIDLVKMIDALEPRP